MRLQRDIWELVDGPKPPRTRKKSKWLSFSLRGTGVIVLLFLVAADLPPQPVTFTAELPFEVVQQMEEAGKVCRDARDSGGSSCATEVWKSCHLADQTSDNFKGSPSLGDVQAKMYLCDLAVIADAGDLAKSLASRYRDQYYTSGWFKTVKVDEGNTSFLLFQDLFYVELSALIIKPVNSGTPLADQFFIISTPRRSATNYLRKYSGYTDMSSDTVKKLIALRSSVRYSFRPYSGPGSYYHGDFYAVGIREDQDWQAIGRNLWQQPPGSAHNHGITEQNCTMARLAVRENQSGWDELLDHCFQLADDCANRADSFSVSCSLTKGAAEFESMWQRLPEICAPAEGNDEQLASAEKTSNIEEPAGVEEPSGDACYQAALAICKYQNVSPDDQWIEQLISMRDFACAAAARTPDLQYVKVDDRVPYRTTP